MERSPVASRLPPGITTVTLADLDLLIALKSFPLFLKHVTVLDPTKGGTPFEVWPHLAKVCEALEKHRALVILKPKQIGMSWLLASYALWTAMYHDGARVLLYSKGELESRELLAKVRYIYDHLPAHLRTALKGEGNSQELIFPSRSSQILALPSTKAAGVGFSATLVIMDEADFFEFLAENYDTAAKPTVDAGGQIVLVSTANPAHMVSPFRSLYRAAGEGRAGENGFVSLFFPWNVRPGRDTAWYEATRAGAMDAAVFEKNYPRAAEEALAPAQALAAFDLVVLASMREECRPPTKRLGKARIWQGWIAGHPYAAFSDTSHGVGADYSVTVVLDGRTGLVVADVLTNVMEPAAFAHESMMLLKEFREPLWAPEDNEWGAVVIQVARDMAYPRLYNRDESGKTEKWGWRTDERTRFLLWGELREAVQQRLITVPAEDGLSQFFGVILNPSKGGRPEAMAGAHDDYPMAVGGAWQLRKQARASGPVTPIPWGW